MGNFKSVGDTSAIADSYSSSGAITVYLESGVDKYLIGKKWFSGLNERIHFVAASKEESLGDGGCQVVMNKVKENRKNGQAAFGIVDRDVLLQERHLRDAFFWMTDDNAFTEAEPFGESVFVLHRWELENYLLHPEAIHQLIWDKKFIEPKHSPDQLAELFCKEESNFITATAFSTLHAEYRSEGGKQASEKDSFNLKGKGLKKQVCDRTGCTPEQLNEHQNKMKAFTEDEAENSIERWENICRILDGKRVSYRIEELLGEKSDLIEENRSFLADTIANLPDEKKGHWVRIKQWLMNQVSKNQVLS